MKRRPYLLLAPLALLSCAPAPPVLCDRIPEGGCPLDRGGTCEDQACDALYGCYNGVWARVETCDRGSGEAGGGSGGAGGAGGAAGAGAGAGGGECTPIRFDHSMESTGCMPDLQSPDCPAVLAEICPEKACTTGCLDFFLCEADGWTAVAYCDEDGNFYQAPR